MATEATHLKKAASNHAFLESLGDDYPDWLATVAFYTAVHLVEALFARKHTPSHSHGDRNRTLKQRYPAIWQDFRPLYSVSKLVRYSDYWLSATKARNELIAKRLVSVEKLVRQELGLPLNQVAKSAVSS